VRKKTIALVAGLVVLLGLAFAVPASANTANCRDMLADEFQGTPWISAGSLGRVAVCFGTDNNYSPNTLGNIMQVKTHDWTNDRPDGIYVEYVTWDSPTVWQSLAGSRDNYGGPATISTQVDNWRIGVKYVRVRQAFTNVYRYLFISTGAGGCGLSGYGACRY
jgi:hypothetical protein